MFVGVEVVKDSEVLIARNFTFSFIKLLTCKKGSWLGLFNGGVDKWRNSWNADFLVSTSPGGRGLTSAAVDILRVLSLAKDSGFPIACKEYRDVTKAESFEIIKSKLYALVFRSYAVQIS